MVNRLLGIIYTLMNKESVTAAELAQRFEVSSRTIYRDIEELSMAGIPVYARKGKKGGISLTEQFVLNKLLLSKEEQQQILAALLSLQETVTPGEQKTLQKLQTFFQTEPVNWISIDFSDWSGTRQQLYEDMKNAILTHRVMRFDYYGQYHEMTGRVVEPVQLLFKEYTWYLKAYCRQRQAMRLFKVQRMKHVEVLEERFVPRTDWQQEEEKQFQAVQQEIMVLIDGKEAYRVYDRFEESEIEQLENGDFLVRLHYYLDDWVYGMLLSFGASATVISPEGVRLEICRRAQAMLKNYISL